jgi:hypothetical protein
MELHEDNHLLPPPNQNQICSMEYSSNHPLYTAKKENQISLIYKEIHNGAVSKSYVTNGLLINGEYVFAHFLIY